MEVNDRGRKAARTTGQAVTQAVPSQRALATYERSGAGGRRWGDDGEEIGFVEWLEHGRRLGALSTSIAWSIGDWVNFGNQKFGEKYREAEQVTGYDVKSLMNMSYVASRVAAARRRPELPWSHHAEVAGLEPTEQERWLAIAVERRLSVRRMRDELRLERVRRRRLQVAREDGTEPAVVGEVGTGDAPVAVTAVTAVTTVTTETGRAETAVVHQAPADADASWHCPRCGHTVLKVDSA